MLFEYVMMIGALVAFLMVVLAVAKKVVIAMMTPEQRQHFQAMEKARELRELKATGQLVQSETLSEEEQEEEDWKEACLEYPQLDETKDRETLLIVANLIKGRRLHEEGV